MGEREEEPARWKHHMRRGEMLEAWAISDAIIARSETWQNLSPHRHLRPVWRGDQVEGKRVLVRCHHGLGDTIQFVRYMPRLRGVAAEVILGAQAPLIPLFAGIPGVDRLIGMEEADREEAFDLEVEITELPHLFRDTLQTIPADVPYIPLSASTSAAATPVGPVTLRVGIVHQAGDWDDRRSISAELLPAPDDIPGVRLIRLQRRGNRVHIPAGTGLPEGEGDLVEVARLFRALDLLVTVDTMSAHLAGALAVPTWTLLHSDADWRWLEDRQDSPWYPTMRLFRQERAGDWSEVLRWVRSDLGRGAIGPATGRHY